MTKLRAILIHETDRARLFKVADREIWIPRSVTKTIMKFAPDMRGHRECLLEIEDWFAEKNDL